MASSSVNLFRGRKIQLSDKLLTWAVTAGRAIIILTELIALIAFGYRFTLDRQILDLHDQTRQKLAIVNAFTTNEAIYRNLQTRLSLISKAQTASTQMETRIATITSFFPTDFTLNNMTLGTDTLRIDGKFSTIASATDFVNKIKAYKDVTSVNLDKIDNKPSENLIDIVITVGMKPVPSVL